MKSDGGPTGYYALPEGATELGHVISGRGMGFYRGCAFKALYRLGEKDGTSIEYDLNKIEHAVGEMRRALQRGEML